MKSSLALLKVNSGARLLSDLVGGLMISFSRPLDFHSKTLKELAVVAKYFQSRWNIKQFCDPSSPKKFINKKNFKSKRVNLFYTFSLFLFTKSSAVPIWCSVVKMFNASSILALKLIFVNLFSLILGLKKFAGIRYLFINIFNRFC